MPEVHPNSSTAPAHEAWLQSGLTCLDQAGQVLTINRALLDWLELDAGQITGRDFWATLGERHPHWQEALRELRQRQQPFDRLELADAGHEATRWFRLEVSQVNGHAFVRLDSSLPPVAAWSELGWNEPLRSEEAQRQMFLRLTRAEAQLSHLARRWPGVIFSQRTDLSFQFISDRIEEWTGISSAEWQRDPKYFHAVIHECDVAEIEQQLKHTAQSSCANVASFRIRHIKTGRVTYVREHREALFTGSGLLLGYEGIWVDVTRQTIAEKRLTNASWMETLAALTAGLAHDFSNVIAGVQSLSEAFQSQLPADHEFQEGLGLIRQNTQNATEIVRRILSLHRGKPGERNYHDLNELLRELVDLVRKTVPRRIQIQVELTEGQLPVYADAVELRQVFVNLVLNAVDAMPNTGRLTLRTSAHPAFPGAPHLTGTVPPGPCVCVQVQDVGTGIPARHLESIFDPFFTTKPANKGSGLGLYNARLFTEKHHGAISVESTLNVGTTFSLWLPQADFTEAETERHKPRRTRHTLLLVGSPDAPLDGKAAALRQHGFYVVTAGSMDAARELLSAPDYEFSAVLAIITSRESAPQALFQFIRDQRLAVRTVLRIRGRNQDEFDAHLLGNADLVVGADTASAEVPAKISSLLENFQEPTP
jgi:signal transduction histidine kinase